MPISYGARCQPYIAGLVASQVEFARFGRKNSFRLVRVDCMSLPQSDLESGRRLEELGKPLCDPGLPSGATSEHPAQGIPRHGLAV
jgi:hypothetical protein